MPSSRPQAAFEPIPPGIDIGQIVESTPNFEWVTRVHCDMIDHHGVDQFEHLVLLHVILGGKPLVIEGYEHKLDRWTYSIQWLRDNWGTTVVDARDLTAGKNVPMTVQHYLKHMALLTDQWDDHNYKDKDRQRMYLKDIDCPPLWADKLKDQLPLGIFYLNDGTGDTSGLGSLTSFGSGRPDMNHGRGVAKSGDLMSSLPKEMRAENLMCYIGHEGTYTPAHREMCASLGQNIMVEASTATIENGKPTKTGTSIWFMTETKEREVVSEYWLSRLGHDIEIEKHFAQMNAWKQAPFKVYVVEQKLGDLILIPPLAPHQVWNRGTRTMKVAWNRTTVETLEMAINEALPKARMVCRDEQYKNKAIIYFTLQSYSKLLKLADRQKKSGLLQGRNDPKVLQLQKDFKRLQNLFTRIMVSESFLPEKQEKNIELIPFTSFITCSYCRCNIFNRFLTCKSCVEKLPDGEEDTYDVCMDCYAMGRSCKCISRLQWAEQWSWKELTENHDLWRRQIIEFEEVVDSKSPRSLRTEAGLLSSTRTTAQICQNELTRRPFHDINKQAAEDERKSREIEREEIDEVDADGNVKKKKKIRRSEKYIREHGRCHVDCYWEPKWKQAHCSNCDKNYCYGNLFRAYDVMPQEVMADMNWKCPSCRKMCACRHCRHKPGFRQYIPKGTLLGHNTKAVADPRSVESLVDFSHPNISWIQKAGDDHGDDTVRLQRRVRQAEAEMAKNAELGDNYVSGGHGDNVESQILQLAHQEGIPIDPALGMLNAPNPSSIVEDEDAIVEHPEEPQYDPQIALEDQGNLQYLVPAGGIMWDTEHAYETTDAITYVYPELGPLPHAPPAPSEGYTPVLVAGYEPAASTETNDKIEMIERKRRRLKLDEGDRPYKSHKLTNAKPKSRKSLVIKLVINKVKLAQLSTSLGQAPRAVDTATAPVLSSDLQALNLSSHNISAPVAPEQAQENDAVQGDQDDEFTPGRYRDRRKPLPGGASRVGPDAEITRRTTRTQTVTYLEPNEEDFDEVVKPRPHPGPSKLATMEDAIRKLDDQSSDHTSILPTQQHSVRQKSLPSGAVASAVQSRNDKVVASPRPTLGFEAGNGIRTYDDDSESLNDSPLPSREFPADGAQSFTSSAASKISQVKISDSVQANRRAKMAAIEAGSEAEDTENSVTETETETTQQLLPLVPSVNPISNTVARPSVGSKAPRLSLPKTVASTPLTERVRAPPPSVKVPRVSAADWGESSSEDDVPTIHLMRSRLAKGNHVLPPVRGRGTSKRRGRPPKSR